MKDSIRVLLIDDEENVARIVADVLQCFGYDVEVATSGRDGVLRACTSLPDAIVCDARMPELGGEEVILMLKAQPATQHIPIVLTSGYNEPAFAHLADAFLSKPFVVNELNKLILSLLSTRTAVAA
jgi:CheY-like chemotaxis protein